MLDIPILVQLHFIQYPNQFQFDLEKNSKFWQLVFQIKSSLVWEKMTEFRKQKNPNY